MRLGERCRTANSGNTTLRLGGAFYTGGTNSAVAHLSSGTELAYDRTDDICEGSVVLRIVFDVPLSYGANIQVCEGGGDEEGMVLEQGGSNGSSCAHLGAPSPLPTECVHPGRAK